MKSKKILHVVSSLNVGGAERFVIDLSQDIKSRGFNVEILSFGDTDEKLVKVAYSLGIRVHTINNATTILGQIKLVRVLSGAIVIHLHTPRAINVMSMAIKLIGKKTFIYTRHGAADLSSPKWVKQHQKFKPYIDHMTFVSQESLEIFKGVYPWTDISMEVVDNGVLIPKLTPREPSKVLRIGSVGRFVPLKNQISLLKAVALLNSANNNKFAEVHLFGDGECTDELHSFVQDNNLTQHVKFYGMVQEREIIYNSFDVLCVTSETEGLSLAIMEALAFSLPVIATDVGGNSKLVHPQKSGWLFEYNDVESLYRIIEGIIDSPNELETLGRYGREFIEDSFSIQVATEKYLALYGVA